MAPLKARFNAEAMSIENFEGSNGWLTKFTKRHGISFKTVYKICQMK
jgi:hypothetical protein